MMRKFQLSVFQWAMNCFGTDIVFNLQERTHRFLEEALELVQSCGCTREQAHKLVDYVFDRDKGEICQEVAGVTTTLAVLCTAYNVDMEFCSNQELNRISNDKILKLIREKQKTKPKLY